MRYLFIATMIFLLSLNVEAKDAKVDKAKEQAELLSKECYDKTVEPVLDSFFYNDEIKKGYKKYNACQKEIIIAKIKEKSTPENAQKMIKALELMEQGMLEFYGVMYNQVDTGFYGQAVNDMELGRRYEQVLYDVLDYQSIYAKGKWDDLLP